MHYNNYSFGFQITIGLSIDVLKRSICQRWFDINPLHLDLFISRDDKEYVLDSDQSIQYMVCFAAVQHIDSIDIVARRSDAPNSLVLGNNSTTTSSSNCGSLESEAESHSEPHKSNAWENCITGVGQRFPGGADEFRTSLKKYAIHKGFKFEYKKNSSDRITVVCSRHKDKECTWRIHASPKFKLAKFFEIRKMVGEHTCGITFKDLRNPKMTSQVVKSTILDLIRDRPLTKPSDIIDYFRREFGVKLSYYFAYTGKSHAIKEVHGDDYASYQQLASYTNSINESNPGSYVVLEVDEATRKFQREFISYKACIYGFNFCRALVALDGCHLKAKYKGCMLSATGTNGDGGKFTSFFFF